MAYGENTLGTTRGFLYRVAGNIRKFVNDPLVTAKYSDAKLIEYIRMAWDTVLGEITRMGSDTARCYYPITITADVQEIVLPPTVGELLAIVKRNDIDGITAEIRPRGYYHPWGPGYTIEGNTLRLSPTWTVGDTGYEIEYKPSGEAWIHEGRVVSSVAGSESITTSFTIPSTAAWDGSDTTGGLVGGVIDERVNAYGGYMVRIWSGTVLDTGTDLIWAADTTRNVVQERKVTHYDFETGVLTFAPALDPTAVVDDATITGTTKVLAYEVIPQLMASCELVIAARVALMIADTKEKDNIMGTYMSSLRTARLASAKKEARIGPKFQRRVRR